MKVVSPGAFIDYLLLGCTDKQQRPRVERYLLHRGWLDSAQHDENEKSLATTTLVWSDLSNRVLELFGFVWESVGPDTLSQLVSTVNGFPCLPLGISSKKRRQRSPTPTAVTNSAPVSVLNSRKRPQSPIRQLSGVSPLLGGLLRRGLGESGYVGTIPSSNANSSGAFMLASPSRYQPQPTIYTMGSNLSDPMSGLNQSTEVPILRQNQSARLQPGSLRIGSFIGGGK